MISTRTNNIQLIGNLQVFSSPFASLYLDKEDNRLYVFVRVSKPRDSVGLFAVAPVSKNTISQYMQRTLGLRDMFSDDRCQLVQMNGESMSCSLAVDKESVVGQFGKKNMFDTEFCEDEPELRCFIKKYENAF